MDVYENSEMSYCSFLRITCSLGQQRIFLGRTAVQPFLALQLCGLIFLNALEPWSIVRFSRLGWPEESWQVSKPWPGWGLPEQLRLACSPSLRPWVWEGCSLGQGVLHPAAFQEPPAPKPGIPAADSWKFWMCWACAQPWSSLGAYGSQLPRVVPVASQGETAPVAWAAVCGYCCPPKPKP